MMIGKKRFFMNGRKRYKIYRKDIMASRFFSIDSFFINRMAELMERGIEFKAEDREKGEIYIFCDGELKAFKITKDGNLKDISFSFSLKSQAK